MPFINRIDIPHHLNKSTELSGISDSLYSIRKTLEALHRKGLKTMNGEIGTQLFTLSVCLGYCKNDEVQYHYYNSMDSALSRLKNEISELQSLYRKVYEVKHSYADAPLKTKIEPPTYTPPPQSQRISNVVIVPRKEKTKVTAYLITSYNHSPLGMFGSHAALYIHIEGNEPFLYDPNGSYLMGLRGSGAFFSGEEANLKEFIQTHLDDGDYVVKRPLKLTRELATEIIERAINSPEKGGLSCAKSVSSTLMGSYGLEESYQLPIDLEKAVKKIEDKRSFR